MAKEPLYILKLASNPVSTVTRNTTPYGDKEEVIPMYTENGVIDKPIHVEDFKDDGDGKKYFIQTYSMGTIIALNLVSTKLYLESDNNGNYFINGYYKRSLIDDSHQMEYDPHKRFILKRSDSKMSKTATTVLQNQSVLESFRFMVNPQNITFNMAKSNSKVLTSGGWVFQHWGNDIPTIDIKGTTLMMKPAYTMVGDNVFEEDPLTMSKEYQNLMELKRWYNENNMYRNPVKVDYRLGIQYRGVMYIGHFENLSIVEDAEKPRVMDYSFKFAVEEEYGNSTNWNMDTSSNTIPVRN
jgi:hypothetical protein